MVNDNCLNGIQCPRCKSNGPFFIDTSCTGLWRDDGIGGDDCTAFFYNEDSNISCVSCSKRGIVSKFRKEKDGEEQEADSARVKE